MRSHLLVYLNYANGKRHQLIRFAVMVMILAFVVSQAGLFATPDTQVSAEDQFPRTGKISVSSSVNVRAFPTTTSSKVDALLNNHPVTVYEAVKGQLLTDYKTDIWYLITYSTASGSKRTGYVLSSFVVLDPLVPVTPDPVFEAYLNEQGFPDSYRPMLRALNADYPEWAFTALHVNMTWDAAVTGQARAGVSLIENAVNDNWKTTDPVGYNWLTNQWKIYDSDRWVMAKRDVIAYYMDPRNMLSPTLIFQFENLAYNPVVHTAAGVSNILTGTFMSANNTYQYTVGETVNTITYVDTFLQAAEISDVSPYHLTSRVVQEVGASGSGSVSGTYPGYEGYYNFFNIGATSSTDPVANGLEYAMYGPLRKPREEITDQKALDYIDLIRIPWNNRYDSIAGGAIFLGNNYINRNQNTLYLQRFNLLGSSYPSHQYMTNIRAIPSEASRLARGYVNQDAMNNSFEFLIPVFKEMPGTASLMPAASGNPNNWLKSLQVNGQNVTPSFKPEVTDGYSVIVPSDVASVEIIAEPVSTKASINGAAAGLLKKTYPLNVGENKLELAVKAENGNVRKYSLNVIRTTPEPGVLHSDVFRIENGYIFGFDPGQELNQASKVIENMHLPEHYQIRIVNAEGQPVEGAVATGHRIELVLADLVSDSLTIVVYGDTKGTGRTSVVDINNVLDHAVKRIELKDAYFLAADVDKDGRIGVTDLNKILDHTVKRNILVQN